MGATRKVISLVDSVRWTEPDGTIREFPADGDELDHGQSSGKGKTFDLPTSEFDRLSEAGAVEAAKAETKKAESKPAKPADAAPKPLTGPQCDAEAKRLGVTFPKKAKVAEKRQIIADAQAAEAAAAEPETPAEGEGTGETPADGE